MISPTVRLDVLVAMLERDGKLPPDLLQEYNSLIASTKEIRKEKESRANCAPTVEFYEGQ